MRINWIVKNTNWAFDNLCKHLIRKMGKHKHTTDCSNGDINFVCSPNFFKFRKSESTTILHLDSHRWYDPNGINAKDY